jgi:hypothetical protein
VPRSLGTNPANFLTAAPGLKIILISQAERKLVLW